MHLISLRLPLHMGRSSVMISHNTTPKLNMSALLVTLPAGKAGKSPHALDCHHCAMHGNLQVQMLRICLCSGDLCKGYFTPESPPYPPRSPADLA